jgi:hypothetical protein
MPTYGCKEDIFFSIAHKENIWLPLHGHGKRLVSTVNNELFG